MPDNVLADIKRLWREIDLLKQFEIPRPDRKLITPLTSASWAGGSFSTTAKTLINLNSTFGAPTRIKEVLIWYAIRDSGSAANDTWMILDATATAGAGPSFGCAGLANNARARGELTVVCNTDGNVYYQINASGVNTMNIFLRVFGYRL